MYPKTNVLKYQSQKLINYELRKEFSLTTRHEMDMLASRPHFYPYTRTGWLDTVCKLEKFCYTSAHNQWNSQSFCIKECGFTCIVNCWIWWGNNGLFGFMTQRDRLTTSAARSKCHCRLVKSMLSLKKKHKNKQLQLITNENSRAMCYTTAAIQIITEEPCFTTVDIQMKIHKLCFTWQEGGGRGNVCLYVVVCVRKWGGERRSSPIEKVREKRRMRRVSHRKWVYKCKFLV